MASLIGQLKVVLGLETAAFETGAKRAAAQVDHFGSKAEKMGYQIGTMGKALGAAAVAFAGSQIFSTLKDLTMRGLDYASSLGEQAQQLGVTTDALQEYRYAASQVGLESADMDQALSQLTKRIGQAAEGAKKPAEAFKTLGISLRDTQGNLLTAGDAIPLIADALAKIPDPAARAALEVDLFGKSGQKLDTLLAGGAGAVNGLRDAAHKLGIVLSSEQIQKADDAADKLSAVKQVMEARIAGVVADNADAILKLADALSKLIEKAIKAAQAMHDFVNSPAGKLLGKLNDAASWASPLGAVGNVLGKAAETYGKTGGGGGGGGGKNPAAKGNPWAGAVMPGTLLKRQLTGSTIARTGLFSRDWAQSGALSAEIKQQVDQLQLYDILAKGVHRDLGGALDGVTAKVEELAARSADMAHAMDVSFAQAADGILGAMDRMAGAFRGGSFLDKLGAVLNFGLSLGSAGLFGKKIQTGINLPKRADGGPVLGGRMHLVGERGPELFVPGGHGTIVPNHRLALGGGGGTTNIFKGNLMTPEFWQMIQLGDQRAAQAGALGGERRVALRQSRRLA